VANLERAKLPLPLAFSFLFLLSALCVLLAPRLLLLSPLRIRNSALLLFPLKSPRR